MCTCPGCAASSGSPRRSPATCIRCGGGACGWTRPPGPAAGPPVTVYLPGRRPLGAPADRTPAVRLAERGQSFAVAEAGGWEILVAVQGLTGGPAVIRTFVSNAELGRGVTGAWLVLAGLGVILLGLGVAVADRLVGTVTLPIGELARVSHVLAAGDLEARASLAGPPEVREVAGGLNHLAGRIRDLIWQERERVAGLGLDIARQTAEVSGGSLTIKPGNGGHVVVELGPPQSALEPR